ncbi:hypothetical protein JOF53_001109 [Crossiella equi]|uniref:Secreted protein n=1 Tax=Crossiella equi TaxID=130796 RepID=A0ABS5A6L7_9PSEU|nr:hypothetical protein [Crossiella equi]
MTVAGGLLVGLLPVAPGDPAPPPLSPPDGHCLPASEVVVIQPPWPLPGRRSSAWAWASGRAASPC